MSVGSDTSEAIAIGLDIAVKIAGWIAASRAGDEAARAHAESSIRALAAVADGLPASERADHDAAIRDAVAGD